MPEDEASPARMALPCSGFNPTPARPGRARMLKMALDTSLITTSKRIQHGPGVDAAPQEQRRHPSAARSALDRLERAGTLRRLHRDAAALRDKLEGLGVIVDRGRAGTGMGAGGAVVLALQGDAEAFLLGRFGEARRGDESGGTGERAGECESRGQLVGHVRSSVM